MVSTAGGLAYVREKYTGKRRQRQKEAGLEAF